MEIMKLLNALPGAVSQGVIWGIMAIGVYITYRILDVADLTVDGSIATGGAVAAVLIISSQLPALLGFRVGWAEMLQAPSVDALAAAFGLAALAWFIQPWAFVLAASWVVAVLYWRDSRSATLATLAVPVTGKELP